MNNVRMRPEVARARQLRRDMSEPEVMLWSRLKRLRPFGYPFRRQHPLHGYYLDFVCLSRRLVVEVDGWQHSDERHAEHDFVRDRVLQRAGFSVMRFQTSEVRRNLSGVVDRIIGELGRPAPRSGPDFPTLAASPPVPPQGGGEA